MQEEVGVEVTERAARASVPQRLSLSVCAMTRGGPTRLAAVLELLRPLAAEIVVALDDREEAQAEQVAAVADEVVLFPYRDPADSLVPWLHSQCGEAWILNIDDDEVPSERLLARLPELLTADVTHWWLPRRWLVGDAATYLDEPPWIPDYQLRLYRNDGTTLRFSDEFHRPVVVLGAAGFSTDPLWHLDCLLNSFESRRAKVLAYERARRGMRVAGVAHNSGFYLPELHPAARTAVVPEADSLRIARVLNQPEPVPLVRGVVRRAVSEEIESLWPGEPFEAALYEAELTRLETLDRLIAGAQHTVPFVIENRSSLTWHRGPDAAPLIQVGTRWIDDGGSVKPGIHTPLPADFSPGRSFVVPVHVRAPLEPSRYRLVVDLVHEHVRWFERPVEWMVDVVPPRRVAVIGRGTPLARTLDRIHLEPELDPVLVERGEELRSERYGHERAPGLGGYLLDGLDGPITPRGLVVLAARTARLLRRARRMPEGKPSVPLPRGAETFLTVLAGCERLEISSIDWEWHAARTRELWRLAATAASARRLGLQVDVEPDALRIDIGRLDRLLARLVKGRRS